MGMVSSSTHSITKYLEADWCHLDRRWGGAPADPGRVGPHELELVTAVEVFSGAGERVEGRSTSARDVAAKDHGYLDALKVHGVESPGFW